MVNKPYKVLVTDKVRKVILKLPTVVASRIENNLLALEQDPRPTGCKKLKSRAGYRIRVGDYRIIYEIKDATLIVIVVNLGNRKDIYK